MQIAAPWFFPKRALFYWAGVHGDQLREGESHATLCHTISVCIVDGKMYDDEHYHHRFRLIDEDHGTLFCKDIEIHVLELGKFSLTAEQVQTPLQQWCYFLKHGEELDDEKLPASLDTPLIRKAMEVLMPLSQDEIERNRYLDRRRAEREAADREYGLANAREIGFEEGHEEGREEGFEEGIEEGIEKGIEKGFKLGIDKGEMIGRIHVCQRLLKQPLTPRAELMQRSDAELLHQAEALEGLLSPGGHGTE